MNTRFPTPFFSGHHRRFPILAVLATAALIAGCAHPLAIGPDLAKIERKVDDRQIELNVGYYMSATDKDRMVITPGGGGDTVAYSTLQGHGGRVLQDARKRLQVSDPAQVTNRRGGDSKELHQLRHIT